MQSINYEKKVDGVKNPLDLTKELIDTFCGFVEKLSSNLIVPLSLNDLAESHSKLTDSIKKKMQDNSQKYVGVTLTIGPIDSENKKIKMKLEMYSQGAGNKWHKIEGMKEANLTVLQEEELPKVDGRSISYEII